MNLWLVDDHPVFRNGMTVMLGKLFQGALITEIGDNAELMNHVAQSGVPELVILDLVFPCLLYTSPSPRDLSTSRMPSSA